MPIKDNIGSTLLWADDIEPDCKRQIAAMSQLRILDSHIAVMPDAHLGKGACIGTVIPTREAVVPAAVGVDIGCGMVAAKTTLRANDLPDSLRACRFAVEKAVPVGRGRHVRSQLKGHGTPAWLRRMVRTTDHLDEVVPRDWDTHIGTLGGGNHFIELSLDEDDAAWIVLHSGSRGPGNRIGQRWIAEAKREMERFHIALPDQDLAYLREGSTAFDDYWTALSWAQKFAAWNREIILRLTVGALGSELPPFGLKDKAINCHHNYVATVDTDDVPVDYSPRKRGPGRTRFLTRKGAISAREGELGIVPGSMGASTYIVRGRGNPRSHLSCSHGAGRRLSRRRAKDTYDLIDLEKQTEGVECRTDSGVLDEIPAAYKDIDDVMECQSDLVAVEAKLRAVMNVKG